jgi:hypothetical protein
MYYYKSPKDLEPKGTLLLEDCTVGPLVGTHAGCSTGFQIVFPWYTYRFTSKQKDGSADYFNKWISAIEAAIASGKADDRRASSASAAGANANGAPSVAPLNFSSGLFTDDNGGGDVSESDDEDEVDVDEEFNQLQMDRQAERAQRMQKERENQTNHRATGSGSSIGAGLSRTSSVVGTEGGSAAEGDAAAVPATTTSVPSVRSANAQRLREAVLKKGQRIYSSSLLEETVLSKFVTGKKTVHERYYVLSSDYEYLYWSPKPGAASKPEKQVSISEITYVEYGMSDALVRLRGLTAEQTNRCFVVHCADGKAVEIMCPSRALCDQWFMGLQALVAAKKPHVDVRTVVDMAWHRLRVVLMERAQKTQVTFGMFVARRIKEVASM